jgi:hypothetical protein
MILVFLDLRLRLSRLRGQFDSRYQMQKIVESFTIRGSFVRASPQPNEGNREVDCAERSPLIRCKLPPLLFSRMRGAVALT